MLRQRGGRQLARAHGLQPALGVVEQRGRQGLAVQIAAQLRCRVQQHIGRGQALLAGVAQRRLGRLALVDPEKAHLGVRRARAQWNSVKDELERELAACQGEPVVIAMHHPPFRTLINSMDHYGLQSGAAELEAIVARHPNVERIICGHMHRSIQARFGGTIAATIPSPAHQINLDLAANAPLMWTLEPPGYALHVLPKGGRMVTHQVASSVFEGPYPFRS